MEYGRPRAGQRTGAAELWRCFSGPHDPSSIPAPAAPAKTAASAVEDRLRGLNPDAISAREALNLLYELREMLPESPAGSAR